MLLTTTMSMFQRFAKTLAIKKIKHLIMSYVGRLYEINIVGALPFFGLLT